MHQENISALDALTLSDLEAVLDKHTRKRVPVNKYTAFSWSVSRHDLFNRCTRRYYLNYYAPRRVRDRGNHPAISALWWLKQAKSLKMWIGTVVHEVAREAVLAHWEGAALDVDEGIERALKTYNGGVRASRRGTRFQGGWVVLQEHIYPGDHERADWDGAEDRLSRLVEALFNRDAYETILSLPPEAVMEADEPFQSMQFDQTRVFAIPDAMLREGNICHIVDWKTGDVTREQIGFQAGVYAFYANRRYRVPQSDIEVSIVDLSGGGVSVEPPGGTRSLAEAETFIRESMSTMQNLIENEQYHTAAISDFPMTDDLSICQGCNFKRACWRHELEWTD
jgi:hypothetical protein